MYLLNSTSGTNWEALESRSEENIDYSDIPPLTDEFFERSTLRIPADKADNLVQLNLAQSIPLVKMRRRQCRVPTIFWVGKRHCRLLYIIPVLPELISSLTPSP
ncbi:hypothetical protein [Tychonema sp. BBK16]|uniref:hypothetical protein n=1 Tax=Tychonema sp. BBK16 TaxID=2699888 RepID=UPI001F26B278|nr:hypothetical protein [Tychonema sp. BBK16]MCF6371672.1 hypothetical protein [Tychonema sp. BBK16]